MKLPGENGDQDDDLTEMQQSLITPCGKIQSRIP